MPGIDKSRVIGKDDKDLDEFMCGICQDLFDEPVVTQCCRQIFCTICINQWLINHNTCPIDRKSLSTNQLSPAPRIIINLINKFYIKCVNYGNGCQSIVKYEEMANHMKSCNTCDSCKTSQLENETLKKELDQLNRKLNIAKNLLADKQIEISSLKCEVENHKTELEQLYQQFYHQLNEMRGIPDRFTQVLIKKLEEVKIELDPNENNARATYPSERVYYYSAEDSDQEILDKHLERLFPGTTDETDTHSVRRCVSPQENSFRLHGQQKPMKRRQHILKISLDNRKHECISDDMDILRK